MESLWNKLTCDNTNRLSTRWTKVQELQNLCKKLVSTSFSVRWWKCHDLLEAKAKQNWGCTHKNVLLFPSILLTILLFFLCLFPSKEGNRNDTFHCCFITLTNWWQTKIIMTRAETDCRIVLVKQKRYFMCQSVLRSLSFELTPGGTWVQVKSQHHSYQMKADLFP